MMLKTEEEPIYETVSLFDHLLLVFLIFFVGQTVAKFTLLIWPEFSGQLVAESRGFQLNVSN